MTNYELNERGIFTEIDFENKINDAIKTISQTIKQPKLSFEKIRHSTHQGFTINGEYFSGTYLTYLISNQEKVLGELNCFLERRKNYIQISSKEYY
ncbi:hypothetical protein [Yeosuana sp.]|uniref:hypothetical protein n=1 Tax=Yeosuana sp. TaxID=2529388 RepID=UPI004055272E|tara:strand:+ start:123 stop:410 length:288 start_codon:yes stop_codon:yes gene_type:complete